MLSDDTVILETVHGSHLYGLAHPGSDHDLFRVVYKRRKALVRFDGHEDHREFGLDKFLEYVYTGSHQSCEALFSPVAYIHPYYAPMFRSMRVTGSTVSSAYRRTIRAFSFGDEKKRRHAVRLALNLRDIQRCGRFNPRLSEQQRATVLSLASALSGDELFDAATSLR